MVVDAVVFDHPQLINSSCERVSEKYARREQGDVGTWLNVGGEDSGSDDRNSGEHFGSGRHQIKRGRLRKGQ